MTTIIAHFDGQVFVPDEPVNGLRPGDAVQLFVKSTSNATIPPCPEASNSQDSTAFWKWLLENPVDDGLPADLGHQHDHYLYGTPKKVD